MEATEALELPAVNSSACKSQGKSQKGPRRGLLLWSVCFTEITWGTSGTCSSRTLVWLDLGFAPSTTSGTHTATHFPTRDIQNHCLSLPLFQAGITSRQINSSMAAGGWTGVVAIQTYHQWLKNLPCAKWAQKQVAWMSQTQMWCWRWACAECGKCAGTARSSDALLLCHMLWPM